MNIQILSKPDNNVVAEGTLDLTSCELKINTQMDAEKIKSFSDEFLENGNFKSDIISSCEKEDSSFKKAKKYLKKLKGKDGDEIMYRILRLFVKKVPFQAHPGPTSHTDSATEDHLKHATTRRDKLS